MPPDPILNPLTVNPNILALLLMQHLNFEMSAESRVGKGRQLKRPLGHVSVSLGQHATIDVSRNLKRGASFGAMVCALALGVVGMDINFLR